MQNYVLFTDVDCDMTPAIAAEYGYHIISMPYSIDGKTTYPYEDFEVFDAKPYYDMLRAGTTPTTSAVTYEKYIEYFEPFFAEGKDILYVHFSRAMSGTFSNMDKAVATLLEKYPERKFHALDTKGISTLCFAMCREIGDMYLAGKSAEEVMAWGKENADHYAFYMFVDDLKFFRRSGRVGGLAGTVGTLLGIRPIIYVNAEGKMLSIGKEKGRNKAVARVMQYVRELGDNIADHRIYIGNSDAPEFVEMLREALVAEYGEDLNIEVVMVNPTPGAHCGPNGAGIAFRSIKR